MRLFVALTFPDALREALARAIGELSADVEGVKWVREEQLHLTCKFLGEVAEDHLVELSEALGAVESPPLSLGARGLGRFPERGAPRVVWAALHGDLEALTALVARVEAATERLGFAREQRPFRAHVTLGRVKDPRRARGLDGALERVGPRVSVDPLPVLGMALMHSTLTPTGPVYRELAAWKY